MAGRFSSMGVGPNRYSGGDVVKRERTNGQFQADLARPHLGTAERTITKMAPWIVSGSSGQALTSCCKLASSASDFAAREKSNRRKAFEHLEVGSIGSIPVGSWQKLGSGKTGGADSHGRRVISRRVSRIPFRSSSVGSGAGCK